jgi:hypothetical protein
MLIKAVFAKIVVFRTMSKSVLIKATGNPFVIVLPLTVLILCFVYYLSVNSNKVYEKSLNK